MFAKKRALRKERLLPFHNLVEDSLNIIPHILRYHGDRHHINRQWQQGVGQGLLSVKPTFRQDENPTKYSYLLYVLKTKPRNSIWEFGG